MSSRRVQELGSSVLLASAARLGSSAATGCLTGRVLDVRLALQTPRGQSESALSAYIPRTRWSGESMLMVAIGIVEDSRQDASSLELPVIA